MSDQEFIFAPPTINVSFAIRPVDLALNSFMLLNQTEVTNGLAPWIDATRRGISRDRLEVHDMVFSMMMKGIDPKEDFPSFPDYIAYVESLDAVGIRDRVIEGLVSMAAEYDLEASATQMLSDKQDYLRVVRGTLGAKYAKKGMDFDINVYVRAHPLLTDPTAMKAVILEHMHHMWAYYLQDEWERALPMLQESVEAFRQLDYTGMTAIEAARIVTGRDLSAVWPQLETAQELVFMPSPHIGPYVTMYSTQEATFIIYGARVPEGVQPRSAALSRSELLTRLNALADDTRLAILELLKGGNELFAQDIMTRLNLSQSSASRHLRQLSATGFLVEKRREVAKYYTLNTERVEDTLQAIRRFLNS